MLCQPRVMHVLCPVAFAGFFIVSAFGTVHRNLAMLVGKKHPSTWSGRGGLCVDFVGALGQQPTGRRSFEAQTWRVIPLMVAPVPDFELAENAAEAADLPPEVS